MIGTAGFAATAFGFVFAAAGTLLAIGAARGRPWLFAARRAALVAFVGLAAANLLMVAALVAHEFSISYVAQVGSRETPLLFTIASLWGALEGSILFWGALLAGMTVLLIARSRSAAGQLRLPVALAVLLALTTFFAFIVVGPGNPWVRLSPAPLDGPGPNPLLQDHPLMALHPPLLYLGFVGLAIPFALTVDALVRNRLDAEWLRVARRWTLGPWVPLTLGLMAGAWWSYAVLGWGGYWGWDPVENVALLPWLTATAFLHSAMVGRRSGQLLTWNVTLVVVSFALTLFATLVTRSGILDSVHAFTRSAIGPLFVGLLSATLAGVAGLLILRLPDRSEGGSLGTRGRAFLFNNLMLAAIAATVFFGTVFPLLAEAVAGTRVSVGAPYFERIVGPLAVALLVLVGIGPSLPWGDWSARTRRALVPGAVVAAVAASAIVVAGGTAAAAASGAAASFAIAQSGTTLVGRIRHGSRGRRRTFVSGRAIGGLVSHIGFGILAVAVLASSAGRRDATVSIRPGDTVPVLGRTISYAGPNEAFAPNRRVSSAMLTIRGGVSDVHLSPALSVYAAAAQAIATPAIVPGVADDLYVTLLDLNAETGEATLRVGVYPMVSWMWPAGGVIALGGFLAALSVRRRHLATAPVPSERRTASAEPLIDVIAG